MFYLFFLRMRSGGITHVFTPERFEGASPVSSSSMKYVSNQGIGAYRIMKAPLSDVAASLISTLAKYDKQIRIHSIEPLASGGVASTPKKYMCGQGIDIHTLLESVNKVSSTFKSRETNSPESNKKSRLNIPNEYSQSVLTNVVKGVSITPSPNKNMNKDRKFFKHSHYSKRPKTMCKNNTRNTNQVKNGSDDIQITKCAYNRQITNGFGGSQITKFVHDSQETDISEDSGLPEVLRSPNQNKNIIDIDPNRKYCHICLVCKRVTTPRKMTLPLSVSAPFPCFTCLKLTPHIPFFGL